jgi:hypothetical protein
MQGEIIFVLQNKEAGSQPLSWQGIAARLYLIERLPSGRNQSGTA